MWLSLLLVFSVLFALSQQKCCNSTSWITKEDDKFKCSLSEFKLEIYDKNKVARNCHEVFGDKVAFFSRLEDGFSWQGNLSDVMFRRKCCPLKFRYNPKRHACEEIPEVNGWVGNGFFKIGLEECQVIVDRLLTNHEMQEQVFLRAANDKCFDSIDENNTMMVRECKSSLQVCEKTRCIRKCCPDGQSFINGSFCKRDFKSGIDLSVIPAVDNSNENFALVHGYKGLVYIIKTREMYHLDQKGLFWKYNRTTNTSEAFPIDYNPTYCVEHAVKAPSANSYYLFKVIQKPQKSIDIKFQISRCLQIISCVCLILTIVGYIVSKEISSLFGKLLISFSIALLLMYSILIYNTFDLHRNSKCKILAFLLLYTAYSSFVWLNILCLDIYWTFCSTKKSSSAQNKEKNLQRFIVFSLYGWGLPFILTMIPLIFYFHPVLPEAIQVSVGKTRCQIDSDSGNYSEVLFLYTPLAMFELLNVVMFVKTISYCLKVKARIQQMNDSRQLTRKNAFELHKERLGLILKLSIVMGVSFLFEIISSFYDFKNTHATRYIEIFFDCFTSLQGLFIFVIFICKRRILTKLRLFGSKRKTSIMSNLTRSSNLSNEHMVLKPVSPKKLNKIMKKQVTV